MKAIVTVHPEESIELSEPESPMAIRVYKPVTNGRRTSVNLHEEVTHTGVQKSLVTALPKTGGRNHHGVITCVVAVADTSVSIARSISIVARMASTPSSRRSNTTPTAPALALVEYADGVRRYILAPKDLKVDTVVRSSMEAIEPEVGCTMPLKFVPLGMTVHNIEFEPRRVEALPFGRFRCVDQPRRPLGHFGAPVG